MNVIQSNLWGISEHVRATYTEDGAILLDIKKGLCYSLNRIAARIWNTIESCNAGINVEGLVVAIETDFEAPREQLKQDVCKYLEELRQAGLAQQNGLDKAAKANTGAH